MKNSFLLAVFLMLLSGGAVAQTIVSPCVKNSSGGCAPVTSTNPLPVHATAGSAVVTSFTGDGALLNNSASTGAVTATLTNATAKSLWGNDSASAAAPSYKTSPVVSGSMTANTLVSVVVTGTAPLTVASTTNVANLNASSLSGATFAAPGTIGGGTPGIATFTTLNATTLSTTNGVALSNLAQSATNTVLGNSTSGTANVAALSVGSCSTAGSALIWTTNTGFGCNTSITAAAVPASGLTGATLASGVTASSLTSLGTLTGLTISGTETITSASSSAVVVGPNGATNPAWQINASAATSVTGLALVTGASAGTIQLQVTSSGTDERLLLIPKGTANTSLRNSTTSTANPNANATVVVSNRSNTVNNKDSIAFQNSNNNIVAQIDGKNESQSAGTGSLELYGFSAGTGTLGLKVQNDGQVALPAIANVATTSAVCVNPTGGLLTYDGTLGTCTVSDGRLKNVDGPITSALSKLLQLKGIYFHWKNKSMGSGPQIGLIAQDVEKVFPELVATDSRGLKSADYQRLTAPIIEALRELKATNDNLRARIAKVERQQRH